VIPLHRHAEPEVIYVLDGLAPRERCHWHLPRRVGRTRSNLILFDSLE
jgi:hypothetical protein